MLGYLCRDSWLAIYVNANVNAPSIRADKHSLIRSLDKEIITVLLSTQLNEHSFV